MKTILFSFVFAVTLLGCDHSSDVAEREISRLVMPVSELSELSKVEVVLAVDDVNNPDPSTPEFIVEMFKEEGINSAVNLTYTWGDPDGPLLIDANVHQFLTNDAAKQNLLGNGDTEIPEGLEQVAGIGDAAIRLDKVIGFVSGDVKVTLSTISEEVKLESIALAYSEWLSSQLQ